LSAFKHPELVGEEHASKETYIRRFNEEILKPLDAWQVVSELENVDYFRAYFLDETIEEKRNVIRAIKESKKTSCAGCTAGHFYRGV
jgi:hypothetical protein